MGRPATNSRTRAAETAVLLLTWLLLTLLLLTWLLRLLLLMLLLLLLLLLLLVVVILSSLWVVRASLDANRTRPNTAWRLDAEGRARKRGGVDS